MQEKKACLGCNRDPDFVGEFKTAAAFEMLLSKKDLNVTEELGLILGREPAEDWKVACDDRSPCWRKKVGHAIAAVAAASETETSYWNLNMLLPHREIF